jgi:hypothetical protein
MADYQHNRGAAGVKTQLYGASSPNSREVGGSLPRILANSATWCANSKGGHAYRPDLRVAIFKFINKHLKGDTTTPVEDSEKYKDLPGKDLRVFATDADIPKDAINGFHDCL